MEEPRFRCVPGTGENVFGYFVQNVLWKPADHIEQGELSHMKKCRGRQRTSQKEDYRVRCPLVQLLQELNFLLEVRIQHLVFSLFENKGCRAGKQNRNPI